MKSISFTNDRPRFRNLRKTIYACLFRFMDVFRSLWKIRGVHASDEKLSTLKLFSIISLHFTTIHIEHILCINDRELKIDKYYYTNQTGNQTKKVINTNKVIKGRLHVNFSLTFNSFIKFYMFQFDTFRCADALLRILFTVSGKNLLRTR